MSTEKYARKLLMFYRFPSLYHHFLTRPAMCTMYIYIDQEVIPSKANKPQGILLELRHEIGITVGLFLEALMHHLRDEITGMRHSIFCRGLFVPEERVDYTSRSVNYAEMPASQEDDNLSRGLIHSVKAKRKHDAPDDFVDRLKRKCIEARGGKSSRLIIGEKVDKMRRLFKRDT